MLNKKLHIFLSFIFLLLGSSFTISYKTYSVLYLIGITNIQFHRMLVTLLLSIIVVFIILSISRYRKVSSIFYYNMYKGNYDVAKKLILKYYNQNSTLFFQHMMFYSFSIGDKGTIEKNMKKFKKKDYSGKGLTCKTYRFLLCFVNDEINNIDLSDLITAHEKKNKKNINLILLLRSIDSINQKSYSQSLELIEKISKRYHYPCIVKIINKVLDTVQLK